MNREDVLRMAWEADKFANKSAAPSGSEWWQLERDTHLAALVAAAERKAMMQLFTDPENQPTQHGTVTVDYMQREIAAERNSWPAEMEAMERQVNILTDALAQAKAEEREACAKVCDDIDTEYEGEDVLATWCAAAIRARGETK